MFNDALEADELLEPEGLGDELLEDDPALTGGLAAGSATHKEIPGEDLHRDSHVLNNPWVIWYGAVKKPPPNQPGGTSSPSTAASTAAPTQVNNSGPAPQVPQPPAVAEVSWEDQLQAVKEFDTVEMFWAAYRELKRPTSMETGSSYHCFKSGIKPMWEDDHNVKGGKWAWTVNVSDLMRLDQMWERLLLAAVGGSIEDDSKADDVVGVVYSRRRTGARMGVWTRDKSTTASLAVLGRKIRELAQIPSDIVLEYTAHDSKKNEVLLRA